MSKAKPKKIKESRTVAHERRVYMYGDEAVDYVVMGTDSAVVVMNERMVLVRADRVRPKSGRHNLVQSDIHQVVKIAKGMQNDK